jgi:hypothetical protein
VTTIPHSWSLDNWPSSVFPHTPGKGKYLTRVNRTELLQCGALVRVGRTLVVIGPRYERFLQKQAARVPGYESNANK